jgi:hypothetical protein
MTVNWLNVQEAAVWVGATTVGVVSVAANQEWTGYKNILIGGAACLSVVVAALKTADFSNLTTGTVLPLPPVPNPVVPVVNPNPNVGG